jgi:DNA-binding transcriptional LysR family regulator
MGRKSKDLIAVRVASGHPERDYYEGVTHATASGLAEMERIEIRDLQVLISVAETGSFRRSAKSLGFGQAAISRRVQKLEDVVGVSVFERHPGGARLTNAGWSFVERVRAILKDLNTGIYAAQSAGGGQQGHLNLGLIASLSIGPLRNVVNAFTLKHPQVKMTFVETERSELLTLLNHRRLDVVMASGEFAGIHGDSETLASERLYVAIPKDGPLAARDRICWDDVRDARFLVSAAEPGPEIHEYLIRRLADLGKHPLVERHRVGREGIMNLVGLDFGISLVAEHWCGVYYPGVVFRPVGHEDERVVFSLVWRPENDNPALRRFLSLARIEAKRNGALSAPSRTPDPSP